jgi:hypothetical protein
MPIKDWVGRHPRLVMWVVLAVGMVIILLWSAKDVGLQIGQWAALVVATVLLAGLCVWIITLDDKGEGKEEGEEI